MNIRLARRGDLSKLEQIYQEYYKDEFPFPFASNEKRRILDKFVVEDDDENIITCGALELLSEVVAITDKSFDARIRREALYKLFQALLFNADKFSFDQIHCTVINDPNWERHLIDIGWKNCKGNFLFHKVSP